MSSRKRWAAAVLAGTIGLASLSTLPTVKRAITGVSQAQYRYMTGKNLPVNIPDDWNFIPGALSYGFFPDQVKVISWNIWRSVNENAVVSALSNYLETHKPDVLLLQEVPLDFWKKESLKKYLDGYDLLYVPTHTEKKEGSMKDRSYGMLTATRHPAMDRKVFPLPEMNNKPLGNIATVQRSLPYIKLRTETGTVGIYNIHFEPWSPPWLRKQQYAHLEKMVDAQNDDFVIVGGDFNPTSSRYLESGLKKLNLRFDSVFPNSKFGLDDIFSSGEVVGNKEGLYGSDHHLIFGFIKF
ncbi:hypothetical protein GOV11_02520 [Candidatus Woesearchaeota archaeon]|nr:hypothetical protein [Candidatus Woesearchaeota archaeon]